MQMEIIMYDAATVNYKELAAFFHRHRQIQLDALGLALADIEDRLENRWTFTDYILARHRGELIGYALLFQIGESRMIEINPGTILGCHPFAAPGYDQDTVSVTLVEASKEAVSLRGFDSLFIDIPWDPAAPAGTYQPFRQRYGDLGFEVIQQVHQMDIPLPVKVENQSPLEGLTIAQISSADPSALFRCHHQAYINGAAQYYFRMNADERLDDFNRIYSETARTHPASLALTRDDQVIGYVMLYASGDFSEVMSLAVHPDHQRQGYGRLLMLECLRRANEYGHTTMHLIVDDKNVHARDLYLRCGFVTTGGKLTFEWKPSKSRTAEG
jgi:ribosomal protein S18 acetylase RimI-like enzyme